MMTMKAKMNEAVKYSHYFIIHLAQSNIKQSTSAHPPSAHCPDTISNITGSCWLPELSAWQAYSVEPSFADGHGHSCRVWMEAISRRVGWRVGGRAAVLIGDMVNNMSSVKLHATWEMIPNSTHTWFDIGRIYRGSFLGSVNGINISPRVARTLAARCRTTHMNTFVICI